ncbi:reverse transcriptase-like protein [Colletotrichum incanum]|nr:reverse transcriptase-like protein [Colletotrichum incanum]
MAVKALNDTAGPHGIVPTLLVFGTYPRINKDSHPSPDIVQRAEAIQKAMKMLQGIRAEVEINRAINTRNGPNLQKVLSLPIQSEVLVWRENKGWTGPYEIQGIEGYTITVRMVNGPTQFRATHVKPYYRDNTIQVATDPDVAQLTPQPQPRKRGRPRKGQRIAVRQSPRANAAYLSQKEKDHQDLAIKLRLDNVITTPGAPYEESDGIEIDALISQGVFSFIRYNPQEHDHIRIYRTRMVREIKNISTKPYEKSRLVIQGYGDWEKEDLLTQAPTIQRMSQRMLLALGPTLVRDFKCQGELRDITQAYTQSDDRLTRTIIARLPKELENKYPKDTLLYITKPLYGLAESGLYWYKTYSEHHKNDLGMTESTYDPCLLYTTEGPDNFGITAMQTDDTLSFVTAPFSQKEEEELVRKGLRAKPKTIMSQSQDVDFNGGRIHSHDKGITFTQKGQVKQLHPVDVSTYDAHQQYISQRARGAYLASICQPEASYDLSVAAQVKQPEKKDIEALNVRLQWQIDNPDRGLNYIPLELTRTKMEHHTLEFNQV